VRALIVSRLYADSGNRAKLHSLAGMGVALAAAVPDRWAAADGTISRTERNDASSGIQIVPVPVRGRIGPLEDLRWKSAVIRRLVGEFRPDVIHIEEEPWTRAAALGIRLARRLGAHSVLSTAESLPRSYSLVQRFRRERNLRLAHGLIAANRLAAALATRPRREGANLILPQLGLAPPPLQPRLPHPGFNIGFVGRLVPERGLDLLFRACVGLAGDWTVSVLGTGPSQEELEALAQRLGISARVSWLGALPRAAAEAVWARLDCVVFPSRTTPHWVLGTGQGVLQAMASGVAVIGTDSGAFPELVGDAGRVVPEEDAAALTAALQQLYADRSECERLGSVGRRRVLEHFSPDAIAGKTLAFWRSLMPASG
jgi:glycosyltransferase involved in cell wall biosynthesis